jgi:hypothetical protein
VPLSTQKVYKGNQTRASKKTKTKEKEKTRKTHKEPRNQNPKPKPTKNTLDYITSIALLPLPWLERTPQASNLIEHSKFLTSLPPLVLRTEAGSS